MRDLLGLVGRLPLRLRVDAAVVSSSSEVYLGALGALAMRADVREGAREEDCVSFRFLDEEGALLVVVMAGCAEGGRNIPSSFNWALLRWMFACRRVSISRSRGWSGSVEERMVEERVMMSVIGMRKI